MIKFKALIHKETGTVIKYLDWLKNFQGAKAFRTDKGFYYSYIEMLWNDDFEIIYNPEFTMEELGIIFRGKQNLDDKLMEKIHKNFNDKEFIRHKYGIEL